MTNRSAGVEEEVKRLRIELDDYRESVKGLYASASSAQWDELSSRLRPDSERCIPRTMTKEVAREGSDDVERVTLTPDGVVQVNDGYGVIVEMKKHFREGDLRHFDQIFSYDDDLLGWWTRSSRIPLHDLVLLTHMFSSVNAKDAYDAWRNAGYSFDRNFSIVEFGHADQANRWYWLRRVDGTDPLSDSTHDQGLRKGKKIGERALILTTQKYEFYDDKPPLIHMLIRIQQSVLPLLFSEDQFDDETESGHPTVQTSAGEIRSILHQMHCDERHSERQPHLPKLAWVREALAIYSKMGLARIVDPSEDVYKIVLKRPQEKDFVRFFAKKLLEVGKNEKEGSVQGEARQVQDAVQRSLFETDR